MARLITNFYKVVMFPLFVIQPFLFMSILYWLAGLHSGELLERNLV